MEPEVASGGVASQLRGYTGTALFGEVKRSVNPDRIKLLNQCDRSLNTVILGNYSLFSSLHLDRRLTENNRKGGPPYIC